MYKLGIGHIPMYYFIGVQQVTNLATPNYFVPVLYFCYECVYVCAFVSVGKVIFTFSLCRYVCTAASVSRWRYAGCVIKMVMITTLYTTQIVCVYEKCVKLSWPSSTILFSYYYSSRVSHNFLHSSAWFNVRCCISLHHTFFSTNILININASNLFYYRNSALYFFSLKLQFM